MTQKMFSVFRKSSFVLVSRGDFDVFLMPFKKTQTTSALTDPVIFTAKNPRK